MKRFLVPGVAAVLAIALAGLRGEVVVLNFWASWCTPCEVEAPIPPCCSRRPCSSSPRPHPPRRRKADLIDIEDEVMCVTCKIPLNIAEGAQPDSLTAADAKRLAADLARYEG